MDSSFLLCQALSLLPCCFFPFLLRLNAAAAPAVHLSTLCASACLMQACRLLSLTKEFVHWRRYRLFDKKERGSGSNVTSPFSFVDMHQLPTCQSNTTASFLLLLLFVHSLAKCIKLTDIFKLCWTFCLFDFIPVVFRTYSPWQKPWESLKRFLTKEFYVVLSSGKFTKISCSGPEHVDGCLEHKYTVKF